MNHKKVKPINPISARKPIKRKHKDKPKRPLSAYNYFVKEERAKITNAVCCDDINRQKEIDPDLTADLIKKLKKGDGKVSFEELGKLIGLRWKDITSNPERASYYASLAEIDKERHKKDMKAYNEMKEHRSNEARWSSDIHHTMPVHGNQMPSSYVQHQREMTMPLSNMHRGHAGYLPSHHMEPNFAQAQYSGQMPVGGYYDPYHVTGAYNGNENQCQSNVRSTGQMPVGGYYDPYHVTGAYDGNENQFQSNVRSNIYDDYSVTNRQGSYHPYNRPDMLVNANIGDYYLQQRDFYPQRCYSNNSRL